MAFKDIQLTEKLNQVQAYKLRYAVYLTCVPAVVTLVMSLQLVIFGQLNLYFMEGSGLIIHDQIREAYYDQLIQVMLPLTGYLAGLIIACFVVSLMVMNWACSPFSRAQKMVKECLEGKEPVMPNVWSSEGAVVEENIFKLMRAVYKKIPLNEVKFHPRRNPISIGFLLRFGAIYLIISIVTGVVLGTLLNSVHSKVVSLALNLIPNKLSTHFFTAQEEVLSSGTLVLFICALFTYFFIGYHIAKYLNVMSMVFSTIIREQRFPVRLRRTDIYHDLANTINERLVQAGVIKK